MSGDLTLPLGGAQKFQANQVITVLQYMGTNTSPASNSVTVTNCSPRFTLHVAYICNYDSVDFTGFGNAYVNATFTATTRMATSTPGRQHRNHKRFSKQMEHR